MAIESRPEPTEYTFSFRVQTFARAMCMALDIDPDKTFSHNARYSSRPIALLSLGYPIPSIILHSPNWVRFAWEAEKWIYEYSGGQLPKPPDCTPDPMGR